MTENQFLAEIEQISGEDPRLLHHLLLLSEGFELSSVYRESGLRVYRHPRVGGGWFEKSNQSVDVFKDGKWGKYDGHGCWVAGGNDVEDLRRNFGKC